MTVEHRDTARRCGRCERVTLGTLTVTLTEGRNVVLAIKLCVRCRGEVRAIVRDVFKGLT